MRAMTLRLSVRDLFIIVNHIQVRKSVEQTFSKSINLEVLSGAYCKPLSPCLVIDTLTRVLLTRRMERSQTALRLQCYALTLARIL